eukprot:Lithocolla_globosa_v1_NODE_88_length_6608_cov_12.657409.p7 type:complete len:120 gc:universal NODE_88_length_6608_cov_12.657409:3021-3380(+)
MQEPLRSMEPTISVLHSMIRHGIVRPRNIHQPHVDVSFPPWALQNRCHGLERSGCRTTKHEAPLRLLAQWEIHQDGGHSRVQNGTSHFKPSLTQRYWAHLVHSRHPPFSFGNKPDVDIR